MPITATADSDPSTMQAHRQLDVQGLHCPLPMLRAKAELNRMKEGEVLHVIATDPLAPLDFKSWCVRAPHELCGIIEKAQRSEFYIRKGGALSRA